MTYNKYKVSNDGLGQILVGISASTTTIELGAGQGASFETSNFIGTLVQYATSGDPTSNIVKKEKVLVTTRSGDTLTVVRGFGGDTPTTFNSNDFFYLNIVAEIIEDIQDELTRIVDEDIDGLETNKLDSDGELRTGLGNHKVLYTDGSGNETEISLGASGTYLGSNGTTSAPSFQAVPGEITGEIRMWTISTAPANWLICDGSAISRTTYASLFAVIGTAYGVGNGSTTFNIPDLKGKTVVGYNASETEFDSLGETGGEKTHTLTTTEIPAHTHGVTLPESGGVGALGSTWYQGNTGTGITVSSDDGTGGGLAHNNLQPYLTLNYIIKT